MDNGLDFGEGQWFDGESTVFWNGCSDSSSKAMISLLKEGKLIPEVVSDLIYFLDGYISKIPIAKKL